MTDRTLSRANIHGSTSSKATRKWICRIAMCLAIGALSVIAAERASAVGTDLDQAWSTAQQTGWYESPQGSRWLPLSWFVALEQSNSTALFLADDNVRRFGYELRTLSGAALRLPRGFVADTTDDAQFQRTRLRWRENQGSKEPWVGMNCSACHTATVSYQGKTLTVIGGRDDRSGPRRSTGLPRCGNGQVAPHGAFREGSAWGSQPAIERTGEFPHTDRLVSEVAEITLAGNRGEPAAVIRPGADRTQVPHTPGCGCSGNCRHVLGPSGLQPHSRAGTGDL